MPLPIKGLIEVVVCVMPYWNELRRVFPTEVEVSVEEHSRPREILPTPHSLGERDEVLGRCDVGAEPRSVQGGALRWDRELTMLSRNSCGEGNSTTPELPCDGRDRRTPAPSAVFFISEIIKAYLPKNKKKRKEKREKMKRTEEETGSSVTSSVLEKKAKVDDNECPHTKLRLGTCFECGKTVSLEGYTEQSYGIYVRNEVTQEKAEYLLKRRKLSLVLDLDNTLIRCEERPLRGEILDELRGQPSYVSKRGTKVNLLSMDERPNSDVHRVILRPHVNEFLLEMDKLYSISMNTMGTQTYAKNVVSMLDEKTRRIFRRGNIISRDARGSADPKRLAKGLDPQTGGVHVTMIVDDNANVWVEPFKYSVIEIPPCK